MSANLEPQPPVINAWLADAAKQLRNAQVPSARLDSEILLAHSINKSRTYLHAHPEQVICSKMLKLANSYLKLRINRMPIAYIIGQKEFYGRNFFVTPATLIPRPESEEIIELLAKILTNDTNRPLPTPYCLVDMGTGSGCLGITAKLEFPSLDVTLADVSSKALQIASLNAKALGAHANIVESNLFDGLNHKFDIILANLPYVDSTWTCSLETSFEPNLALFASDNGMSLIKKLIDNTPAHLNNLGYLIIESDPCQHKDLICYANDKLLTKIAQKDYAIAFKLNDQ